MIEYDVLGQTGTDVCGQLHPQLVKPEWQQLVLYVHAAILMSHTCCPAGPESVLNGLIMSATGVEQNMFMGGGGLRPGRGAQKLFPHEHPSLAHLHCVSFTVHADLSLNYSERLLGH